MKLRPWILYMTLAASMTAAAGCQSLNAGGPAVQERNIKTVKKFLSLLEQEKIEAFVALFAKDGKQVNPYSSGLFPGVIAGRSALLKFWKPVPGRFDGMKFPITEIHPMGDPNTVLVRFQGRIKLKKGAGYYNNDYFALFKFDGEGKIREYVEIFNPLVVVRTFNLKSKI